MLIGLAAGDFLPLATWRETIEHLFSSEAVLDRISMVVIVGNSRQRVFKEGLSKLGDWTQMAISGVHS